MATWGRRGGAYVVRWREGGKQRSRNVATAEAARRLHREVQLCEDLGRPWAPATALAVPGLDDAAERYLRERARVLQPSSLHHETITLCLFEEWAVARGVERIDGLSRRLLGEWFDELRVSGQRGRRTVETCRKQVSRVFRFWSWLHDHEDFGELVERPRMPDLPQERGGRPTVAPTWEEMDACIAAAGDAWQARVLAVMRFTGLRVAQAMDLRWDDLDLKRLRLVVRGGKSVRESRGRIVPIAPAFAEWLAGLGRREGHVVLAPLFKRDGHERLRPRVFRSRDAARYWLRAKVREEAWKGSPDHAFRRGFVSGLRRAGADADAVEYLVGHSLGLRGVYTDPDALPLVDAVAHVPPFGCARSVRIDSRRRRKS